MRYKILIVTLVLIMAGCGSKGALYLPEKEPVAEQSAAQGPTEEGIQPAEDEEDDKP